MPKLPEKIYLKRCGSVKELFYNKLLWFVPELPEKIYLKRCGSVKALFYNKLLWFMPEPPEKDISKVLVRCR